VGHFTKQASGLSKLEVGLHSSSGPGQIKPLSFIPADFQIFKYFPNDFKLEITKTNLTGFQTNSHFAKG
jgi:hypothetical protein